MVAVSNFNAGWLTERGRPVGRSSPRRLIAVLSLPITLSERSLPIVSHVNISQWDIAASPIFISVRTHREQYSRTYHNAIIMQISAQYLCSKNRSSIPDGTPNFTNITVQCHVTRFFTVRTQAELLRNNHKSITLMMCCWRRKGPCQYDVSSISWVRSCANKMSKTWHLNTKCYRQHRSASLSPLPIHVLTSYWHGL